MIDKDTVQALRELHDHLVVYGREPKGRCLHAPSEVLVFFDRKCPTDGGPVELFHETSCTSVP